jgi:hypothetical protein
MKRAVAILIATGALGVAACGSSKSDACITLLTTHQKLCGHSAVEYCKEAIPAYNQAVREGESLAEAARAKKSCLKVGVEL